MRKPTLMLLVLLLGLPLAAAAEDKAAAGQAVGQQTREALELQRSGQSASTTERPASGEVADRTHRRYVDSFSHPIPESFQDEEREFVKGSN
jgi:hypothetical protein